MLPSRVVVGDSVICQRVKDEAVLLDMSTQQYFGLNEMGTQMWLLLVELGETGAVVDALELRYEVARATVEADLMALIEQLASAGLVRLMASV